MFALSDVGCVRERNEDALHINPELGLAILADGMGGHRSGDVASQLAVETIVETISGLEHAEDSNARLESCLRSANRAVYDASRKHTDHFGMGTTVVTALIADVTAHVAHVGDSRLYLFAKAELKQITEDHTYRAQMSRYGHNPAELSENNAIGKMLVRAIGIEPEVEIDHYEVSVQPGDCLLLCSDGLTDVLCDAEISDILQKKERLKAAAEQLIQQANKKGGPDNISVILIRL